MAETTTPPAWLLGRWRLERAEPGTGILPNTCMEFRRGGSLIYTVSIDGSQAAFQLEYQVVDGLLRTRHPAGSEDAAARVDLGRDGLLQVDIAGKRAWFARDSST